MVHEISWPWILFIGRLCNVVLLLLCIIEIWVYIHNSSNVWDAVHDDENVQSQHWHYIDDSTYTQSTHFLPNTFIIICLKNWAHSIDCTTAIGCNDLNWLNDSWLRHLIVTFHIYIFNSAQSVVLSLLLTRVVIKRPL